MLGWIDRYSGLATYLSAFVALFIAVSTVLIESWRRAHDAAVRRQGADTLFEIYRSELAIALDVLLDRYKNFEANIPIVFETSRDAETFAAPSVFKIVASDATLPLPAAIATFAESLGPYDQRWVALIKEVAAYNVCIVKSIRCKFDVIPALRRVRQACSTSGPLRQRG